MLEGVRLLEEYAKLKHLEKGIELNLAVLEELENLLEDNLEELIEYAKIVKEDEKLLVEKIRALLQTIQRHLTILRQTMERNWEDIEISLLELAVKGRISKATESLLHGEILHRLETLREYLELQCSIFEDDLNRFKLNGKVPLNVYLGFLEKICEFNKDLWR